MRAALTALALTVVSSPEPPRHRPADVPTALRPALARAEEAIRAAACDVERRFGEGDPDANASRCDGARPVPTAGVGRTSARLRNPENAAPAWALAYVAETDGKKAAEVAAMAFDLGDRVGLLRPIETRRRCLGCHAAPERTAESTRAWLSRAYPDDRAWGYALGDLRGFWWADAPKVNSLSPVPRRVRRRRGSGERRPEPRAEVRGGVWLGRRTSVTLAVTAATDLERQATRSGEQVGRATFSFGATVGYVIGRD